MMLHLRYLAWALTALAFVASGASAGLGATYASIEADRSRMEARWSVAATATHTMHTLTLANHAAVREFTRSDGMVFAVAWRGPSRPDLRQLLGDHFAAFQAQTARRIGPRMRRPMMLDQADLVVHSYGHPGGFWGYALIPAMVPVSFPLSALQ